MKKIIIHDKDKEGFEMYAQEIEILGQMHKPFLLGLAGFSIKEPYFIVTPYIPGGSLYDYVSSEPKKDPLSPTENTLIAIGVAYGIMKLHEMKIIHRDLKSPNILLDERKLPIICDFGIARAQATIMTKNIGTPNWMAPEQMELNSYNEKVDVYSYGCILYEMLCHRMPFEELSPLKSASEVIKGNRPKLPHIHKRIRKLIKKCWDQDPERRPSMRHIFKSFVRVEKYFDGTHIKAVEAIIQIIGKQDPDLFPELKQWMREAQKPEDDSIIYKHK